MNGTINLNRAKSDDSREQEQQINRQKNDDALCVATYG